MQMQMSTSVCFAHISKMKKKVACKYCSKKYKRTDGLLVHVREFHFGIKPACPLCGKTMRSTSLKRHLENACQQNEEEEEEHILDNACQQQNEEEEKEPIMENACHQQNEEEEEEYILEQFPIIIEEEYISEQLPESLESWEETVQGTVENATNDKENEEFDINQFLNFN